MYRFDVPSEYTGNNVCTKHTLIFTNLILYSFSSKQISLKDLLEFTNHDKKFWTRTRSKYTDLGEFETIYGYTKL